MYLLSCLKLRGLIPKNYYFQSYYTLKLSKQSLIVDKEGDKLNLYLLLNMVSFGYCSSSTEQAHGGITYLKLS